MRKERLCAIITVVMTAAFFISLLWGYGQYQQNRRALYLLENEYQRAYYNYLAELRDMALSVGKAHSGAALQQAVELGRLHTLCAAAADHMSRLPLRHSQYQRSVEYLNQVGDYADSLAQKLARGEALDKRQRQSLGDIYGQLQEFYAQMEGMEQQVAVGTITFAAETDGASWWQAARTALAGSRTVQGAGAAQELNTADGYFSRVNALLDGAEPLSYNGKYSAHMNSLPALGLAGLPQVSVEEAQRAAEEFLALSGQAGAQPQAWEEIAAGEALPLYSLRYSTVSGQNIYITASRAGGKIISYAHERPVGEARLTADTALTRSRALLQKAGYTDTRLVARQLLGNTLLLQYVPLQQGVLCYPDRLDIILALDNGEMLGFNAEPYWRNHHLRSLPADGHTLEEAQALLGAEAQISGSGLAYISDHAGGEILCHEIRHSVGGEDFLTYIGVEGLQEEQILRGSVAEDGSFYTR